MLKHLAAIDLHSHYNHGAADDHKTSKIYRADLGFLLEQYHHSNVAAGVFSTFASMNNFAVIPEENEYAYHIAQNTSWVYQWVVVDPRQKETFEQAERMLQSPKCVGIKIHPYCHGYETVRYADQVFAFANERNAVVLTHPDAPEQIGNVVPIVDRYPKMKLIIAHLGSEEHIEAIRKAKHQNIYTDTSGYASITNNLLEYAVQQIGADKIFFGTDTYSAGFQRGRVEYASISDEDKQKILRGNAVKLLKEVKGIEV